MKRDYKILVDDVITAIDAIFEFISGLDYNEFINDDKTNSAVIRKFEIIGEAIKNIPEDIKNKHPEISWKDIVGMRDRLIHAYFGVDLKIVWDTIHMNLKDLYHALKEISS